MVKYTGILVKVKTAKSGFLVLKKSLSTQKGLENCQSCLQSNAGKHPTCKYNVL